MLSSFRLALALVALTSTSMAAAVSNTIQFTNSSQHPLIGFEIEAMEAGSQVPATRVPLFLPGPLRPGVAVTIDVAVDEALVARGGHQRLRFYWSSGRECSAFLTVNPKGGPGYAAVGDRICKDDKVPSSSAMGLAAKMLVADGIAERGDPVAAIFEFNALIAEYGQQAASLHRRGELYVYVGRIDLAEVDFRDEAQINPDAGHAFYDQAVVFFHQARGQEALASLSSAIAVSPGNAGYLRDRALLFCLGGDDDLMRRDEAAAAALGDTRPSLGVDCAPAATAADPGGW